MPFALAILLTFVLAAPVTWLQRWVGRIPAVLMVVTLVFTALGVAGWGLTRQMDYLVEDLPGYRANIRTKIAHVRLAGRGSAVEKLQETLEGIKKDLGTEAPKGTVSRPVVVTSNPATGFSAFGWLGPLVSPLSTGVFVAMLVMFMLLEREHLRDRVLSLIGHGHLAATTKALDEAGQRVSRQLLLQTSVNLIYGSLAAAGLWVFGVPYPLFWGACGAVLRFIPYLGPVSAAAGPVLIAFAALPGWKRPLEVAAFYAALELFTNMVLETILYAGAMGVSQVSLMVSVAFWTWLWGPLGLLMATPLTVCLVVLGKHVPGLELPRDTSVRRPALTPENSYYQRLLARDQAEAIEIVERFVKSEPVANTVFDAMLIPALNFAERDRIEGRLSREEEAAVIETTREVLADAAETIRRHGGGGSHPPRSPSPHFWGRASRCASWATRSTGPPMKWRSRCWRISSTICRSPWRSPRTRMQAVESGGVWCGTESSLSCASRISHPARRRRHATW